MARLPLPVVAVVGAAVPPVFIPEQQEGPVVAGRGEVLAERQLQVRFKDTMVEPELLVDPVILAAVAVAPVFKVLLLVLLPGVEEVEEPHL